MAGKLPVEVDVDAVPKQHEQSPPREVNVDDDEEMPPPIPPKSIIL